METGQKEASTTTVHDRLYRDFFERRINHIQLLEQLEAHWRSQAYPILSQHVLRLFEKEAAASRQSVSPRESTLKLKPITFEQRLSLKKTHHVSDSRLKVPEFRASTTPLQTEEIQHIFSLRRDGGYQSQPVSPTAYSVQPPKETSSPMIGKYYSQLTPVKMKISYNSGCDVTKIVKGGKQMISYSDARGMLAATQSTEP